MKEAEKYFIKEWGTGFIDADLQSEKGMVRMSMQDIYETMQSYAKEEVDKALKEKETKSFYCYDELVNNASEDYDSPKCTNQCAKCKNE